MPTVPFAPANPRMMPERALVVADEKERRRQELEDLKAWALKDKEAIEKVDGRLARLVEALREKAEAADAERAKPDGVRDDTRVTRLDQDRTLLQTALEGVDAELRSIQEQLEIADRELQVCLTELEAANHVILTEQRLTGAVPVTILYANDELTHFTDVRAAAIKKAEEQFEMKGVVAVESVIQPFWKGLVPFLDMVDETKVNTGGLGLILSKYPVLDVKKSEEFAAAFEALPLSGDSKAVAAEVKALVGTYRVAREALVGSDPKSAHKHLKELERAAVALKKIPSLWEAKNEPAEVKKRREAFKKKEAEELERHQPEMMEAERKLWESLQEPTDQELLVKAHLAEVAAVPEHPMFDQLKTEDGRLTYGIGLFEKVGLPTGPLSLGAGLTARLADAQAIKAKKSSEHDLLENWKDDTLFLLDPTIHDKDANVKAKVEERVKRLNLQRPSAETIQLILHSVPLNADPAELMKQLRHHVTMYFGALKDKAAPGSVAVKDEAAIMEALDKKLGDLLHGFNELVTGEMQKNQLAAKVDAALLRPDAKAILQLIATVEGISVVDPAKVAKAAEEERKAREFVEGFVASMERTETLVAERAILHKDTVAREALVPQVVKALEAHKGFQATLDEIERVRPLIIDYLLRREMPSGGEDRTERKRLETNWAATHEAEVRTKKTQEDAAKRALLAAEKALKLTEADPELVQLQTEIGKVEALAGALAHIDVNPNALVADITGRDAILKQIPKIDVDGKEYSGVTLVETALAAGSRQPLKQVTTWLPKAIKELTLDEAYGYGLPEAALAAAYTLVEAEAETARTAAEWFQQNFAGRPEKGRLFGMNYKMDAAWKAELEQQVRNVRAEVQRILLDITSERKQAETAALKAKLQHHPEKDRYKANLAALTERETAVQDVLDLLRAAQPGTTPALIGVAYKGLRQVVHTLTNEEPAEHAPSPEAFGLLIKSLERIKQDLATSRQLLDVLDREHDHAVQCIGYVKLVLPGQLTSGPEIDLAGKKTKLVSKGAKIGDFRKEEADKQAAHTAAAQELARVEAETLADRLAKFDLETSQHISKVLDPKGVLTQQDEIQLNQDAAAAEKVLREMEVKLKELIDVNATHYTEWLTKKDALTTLTRHPTELEKVAVESVLKAEQALFAIFEKQKATSKMNAAQFSAWYNGLRAQGAAGLRALRNDLVPGLSP